MIIHGNVVSGAYKGELNKSTRFVQRTVYWVKTLVSNSGEPVLLKQHSDCSLQLKNMGRLAICKY
jgi:V8-like Glu-specific endopeptidase